MPFHRAFFATPEEARTRAATAVAALTAKWKKATTDAGEQAATTAPVVAVRIEGVAPMPASPSATGTVFTDTTLRVTAPDGRTELTRVVMPEEQSGVLLTKASAEVRVSRSVANVGYSEMRCFGRVAASIQVTTTAPTTLTGLIVEDRYSSKKYTCGASSPPGAGTHTVPVTEVSATDLADVSHGSVLEFLAPTPEVSPIARVNSIAAFTVPFGATLTDSSGRIYKALATESAGASSGLSGDSYVSVIVARSMTDDEPTDGIDDDTALAIGDELTFDSTPTGVRARASMSAVVSDAAVPAGAGFTFGGSTYTATAAALFGDFESVLVAVVAPDRGPAYDLAVGDVGTYDPTGFGVPVATTVGASSFPEPYASQVIGSAMEWTSRVYPSTDGRWIADVYTLPLGS
jgi:hypothetical protein